jgi:hypothetical protein
VQPHRGIPFADTERHSNFLYGHFFKIESRHHLEIVRQSAHRLDKAVHPDRVGHCVIETRSRIGDRVAQWLGWPYKSAPDMGDAYILRDAGNIAFYRSLVPQERQSLPYGDPDILREVLDPAGIAFINGRDTAHHGGIGIHNLLQLDQAFVLNIVAEDDAILQSRKNRADASAIGLLACRCAEGAGSYLVVNANSVSANDADKFGQQIT